MDKVSTILNYGHIAEPEEGVKKPRPKNEFYELCKFYSDVFNESLKGDKTGKKPVTPQRFMRDCKKHRRDYELAQLDFHEITSMQEFEHEWKDPQKRAVLLFGRLKNRKLERTT